MTPKHVTPLALACAFAGATLAAPALAQSASASASLSGFTYQLIDLDAADGIAPQVSFFDEKYATRAEHSFYQPGHVQSGKQPGSVAIDSGYAQASATIAAASSSVTAQYSSALGYNQVWAQANREVRFTLSPNTGIMFSALANAAIEADTPITGWASARISGWVEQAIGLNSGIYFSDLLTRREGELDYNLSAFGYAGSAGGNGYVEFSSDLMLSHFNPTSPVPEPAGAAMLLAGLALVGGAGLRRRSLAARPSVNT